MALSTALTRDPRPRQPASRQRHPGRSQTSCACGCRCSSSLSLRLCSTLALLSLPRCCPVHVSGVSARPGQWFPPPPPSTHAIAVHPWAVCASARHWNETEGREPLNVYGINCLCSSMSESKCRDERSFNFGIRLRDGAVSSTDAVVLEYQLTEACAKHGTRVQYRPCAI